MLWLHIHRIVIDPRTGCIVRFTVVDLGVEGDGHVEVVFPACPAKEHDINYAAFEVFVWIVKGVDTFCRDGFAFDTEVGNDMVPVLIELICGSTPAVDHGDFLRVAEDDAIGKSAGGLQLCVSETIAGFVFHEVRAAEEHVFS